jgi:uncharacterized UPF0146 family protein
MLSELFTSITTSCPQYVRHMDYLSEIIAMKGRSRRNREAWQPHLDHSRQFVLSAAEKCRNLNRVVILGAGLLLDVPLKELSSMFKEVVLVDVVLLPEVQKKIRRYENVKFVQHDVTNAAQKLHENVLYGLRELPLAAAPLVMDIDESTGLVVSLNILSQLWVIPRTYALKKLRGLDEELLVNWCRQFVESHYAYLRSLTCSVALIADHAFAKRDKQGDIVSQGSTIYDIELPEPDTSWTWQIAPMAEESQYLSKELTVGAWHWA